jgi:hypothetical protein
VTPTPTISYARESNCKLWGIICETKWTLWKSDEDSSDVTKSMNYIRSESLKDFVGKSSAYAQYLDRNAEQYKQFLYDNVLAELKTLAENPEKRPDEVLAKDPFE